MPFLRLIAAAASFVFMLSSAQAHDVRLGDLEIIHPWARATPPEAKVGGGYLTVVNHGTQPDRLTAVSSPIAAKAQLHTMVMEDNIAKMRELPDGVEIPAGGTVELKPQSFHIMFMGLKKPLTAKESFEAELTFEKAGKIMAEFAVQPIDAGDSMDMNME
jgi:copper(I)-binding protein